MMQLNPPQNEAELLARSAEIEGLSFASLAARLSLPVPLDALKRKGWVGGLIERALGTTAGTSAVPDFHQLGIELKTIPLGMRGKPLESTFVTSINLLTIHQETWETSQCYSKLKRVLWVPVEGDKTIPFPHRRIGRGFLWSADACDASILANDWSDLAGMLGRGALTEVDARMGVYLQVRPKAANARALCYGFDEDGQKVLTLPRGFYLRPSFTEKMMLHTLSN
ncbi:MAG: DNA mismatch repair endonuclease MutH [Legionellaceae bacterium]|nr:DNA mismatch repair endonuclease MutH [Legionellaceae bacterium]